MGMQVGGSAGMPLCLLGLDAYGSGWAVDLHAWPQSEMISRRIIPFLP
jgi:hypothetical protein